MKKENDFTMEQLFQVLKDALRSQGIKMFNEIYPWQTLRQVGVKDGNVIPIVKEIQKVFCEGREFEIGVAVYGKFFGKTSGLLDDTLSNFLNKTVNLLKYCDAENHKQGKSSRSSQKKWKAIGDFILKLLKLVLLPLKKEEK